MRYLILVLWTNVSDTHYYLTQNICFYLKTCLEGILVLNSLIFAMANSSFDYYVIEIMCCC